MTMPNEMPYRGAKEACQAAQASCIRKKGSICEAYDGISCKTCPKYKEGIKRREKRYVQEERQTIRSAVSREGNTIRLRKGKSYFFLEIGKFFSTPPLFVEKRSITFSDEETALIRELFVSVRA